MWTDIVVPRGAPVPGQSEIFGRDVMSEMKKKARLERLAQPGRQIRNYDGRLRDADTFKPEKVLIHDWVEERVAEAERLREMMAAQKRCDFEDFAAIRDLISEKYDARIGGVRGGTELVSIDELTKIQITTTDQKTVTPAIIAAEELVREVMDDLLDGSNEDLRQIVDRAFVRNRQTGKISTTQIRRLASLEINHSKWPKAQKALRDAIENAGVRQYMRFYRRDKLQSPWVQVDLNYSSLEG